MGSLQEALLKVGMVGKETITPAIERGYFNGVIQIHKEKMGVLVFEAYPDEVPDDIQVISMSGGGTGASGKRDVHRHRFASIDFESFLECVSVVSVNVVGDRTKYCRVYVNYEVDTARPGFNYWSNTSYEQLVRKLGALVWEKAVVQYGTKTRVTFSGRRLYSGKPDLRYYFERRE